MEVAYQGSADGLCGMYAIVNALTMACGIEDYPKASRRKSEDTDQVSWRILQRACLALPKEKWPEFLWNGTNFAQLKTMINACVEPVAADGVYVEYPFDKKEPRTIEDFWNRMSEFWEDENIRCAIIGINNPFPHWTAIGLEGRRVYVLDSTAGETMTRMNIASLSARASEAQDRERKKWNIDRQEVALFYRSTD